MSYVWYDWACIFVIYAVIGWILEVSYAALDHGKFVNRGFLNGPVCPIYGFGGVTVIFFLYPYRQQFVIVFLGAILLSTVLEYITGFILEKIFHQKWWDYSNYPFNLQGYVCLKFSILWGIACLLVVTVVHPPIEKLVLWIPVVAKYIGLAVIFVGFVADISVTVATIVNWRRQVLLSKEIVEILRKFSDDVGDHIAGVILKAMDRGTQWKDVFENDARYMEMKEEFEQKRQELDKIKERYNKALKVRNNKHRRLELAFPKLNNTNLILKSGRKHQEETMDEK